MDKFNFKLIWSICMALVFLSMFYLISFTSYFANQLPFIRIIFGVVFILYGGFKVWQVVELLKNQKK